MSEKASEDDFDWVTARYRCSVAEEFARLRCAVENSCVTRRKCLGVDESVQFNVESGDSDSFSVTRKQPGGGPGGVHRVRFCLRLDHIAAVETWENQEQWRMILTLTLNDEGECRFIIDGEGEFLRWQVARRALCRLFFPEPT